MIDGLFFLIRAVKKKAGDRGKDLRTDGVIAIFIMQMFYGCISSFSGDDLKRVILRPDNDRLQDTAAFDGFCQRTDIDERITVIVSRLDLCDRDVYDLVQKALSS